MISEILGAATHLQLNSSGTSVAPWVALMFSLAVAGMAIIYVRAKSESPGQ